jgi:endoribonuclease LACTB2
MRTVPLHAANPSPYTGAGNWTYLIPGDAPVLIDAGVGHEAHLDDLAAAAPDGPAHVVVTHAHGDHVSGAAAILGRWSAARFSKRHWPGRDPEIDAPWHPLEDGEKVMTDHGALEALHTPGHAPDHLAFWHADTRTAFVGDLLVLGSSVFIPASSGGDLVQYLQSLRRLLALRPQRMWPAHGAPIEDPEALIHHYLDHRHRREVQVLTALESGHDTVDAITARIYTGVTGAVVPMARESVLAHLRKLEHDGLARCDGQHWTVLR